MIASRIIGHRGAAHLAPENTLAGIQMAAECGVTWVELDTTLLGDSTPVLFHDEHLDRCTNQQGPLSALSFDTLPLLDAGSWFHPEWVDEPMPHLSDALRLCQELQLGLNLEIKPFDLEPDLVAERVFEQISVYWPTPEKLIISCYNFDLLSAYKALDPQAQIGLLYDHLPELWQLKAEMLEPVSLHCDANLITQSDVQVIKQAGYELYCYTCNDPTQVAVLFDWGVDGIFTDNPPLMQSYIRSNNLNEAFVSL
ncbi:glycerophosphoryl diester phosphodiesterase [Neptuniibacter sp. PT8_73]|uniref:glycerophosphoryl diester phosphodiesterase n=1 Tax=Neptuniibacter sp. PT8_73 TaxID=3398206 RepID=UPI0039F60EC6